MPPESEIPRSNRLKLKPHKHLANRYSTQQKRRAPDQVCPERLESIRVFHGACGGRQRHKRSKSYTAPKLTASDNTVVSIPHC
jgi:hypothetical protein